MRKLTLVLCTLALVVGTGMAQQNSANMNGGDNNNIPNMGRAPKEMNGIGRLDLRVSDAAGNPIPGAYVALESRRTDGFFCEAFSQTDNRGIAIDQYGKQGVPPIHMGNLKLKIKAKGFRTLKMDLAHSALSEPVRVTLVRKG
jgi:hypothetical protein